MALQLIEKGFSDVKCLRGGLTDWQQAGYPVAKGSAVAQ